MLGLSIKRKRVDQELRCEVTAVCTELLMEQGTKSGAGDTGGELPGQEAPRLENEQEELEQAVARLLWESGRTIALAESCSGGLLCHYLTNIPGSSLYLLGGVVAYSNEAKTGILGVDPAVLMEEGAVSGTVAEMMAAGIRRLCPSDIGVSITGIAGPGGATPTKPVGLTYIGLEAEDIRLNRCFQFHGSRIIIKGKAVRQALHLLWLYLAGRL